MATKIICDKCGREIKGYEAYARFDIEPVNSANENTVEACVTIDCCKECAEAFYPSISLISHTPF